MKFLIFLAFLAVALAILKYTEPIVRTFGKSVWAEQHLGAGGSYTLWKLVAMGIILVGFLYLMGVIEFGQWGDTGLDDDEETTYEMQMWSLDRHT